MTRYLCCALLAALLALAAHAAPTAQPPTPQPDPLKIEDTQDFFKDFIMGHLPPDKSEFETDEAYEKRVPKYTQGTVNFVVAMTPLANDKVFSYDIKTQTLTLYGGYFSALSNAEVPFFSNHKRIMRILSVVGETDGHVATTDFGTEYTYKKRWQHFYAFCLVNLNRIPAEYFSADKKGLAFTLTLPPNEAEALSKTVEVIFSMRPLDYRRSLFTRTLYFAPSIKDPDEFSVFDYAIEASLVKVILRNKDTKEIIAQYDIPQNEDAPAAPAATPAP